VDYYVSAKSKHSGDGSRKRPWRTISRAASQAGPGSTVHYARPVTLRRQRAAGASYPLRVGHPVGARITASSTGSVAVVEVTGSYVHLEGFDVSGRGGDGTVGIAGGGNPDYRNHDIEVSGNLVHDVVGTPTRRCWACRGSTRRLPACGSSTMSSTATPTTA
jgi:hypothetical protein